MTPNINNQTLSSLFQRFIDQIAIYWKYRPEQNAELSNSMILSLSDGQERAKTITFNIDSNQDETTWQHNLLSQVQNQLKKTQKKFTKPICYLRLEWVIHQEKTNWKGFSSSLKKYKRNYFRSGFAFEGKREPYLLCTEAELNANACLYGNDEDEATVNDKNLNKYLQARHGSSQVPQFTDETPIIVFKTDGIFINAFTEKIHKLNIMPRNQGRRVTPQLNPDSTLELVDLASHYLSKQIQADGQYRYGYFPVFGREIPTYNTLRHASSTYALIEGYETCRDELNSNYNNTISPNKATAKSLQEIHSQIDKAIHYLLTRNIKYNQDCGYIVDSVSNEIKLGANATTILALVKYLSVFPNTPNQQKYLDTANKLANGIISMQEENGSFIHILDGNNFSFKEKTRTIYYDGEAAFALMRLYGVTREQKILDCVVKAFDFFIANHHENAHDHWLSYCSNELLKYLPEKKYFAFAVNNVNGFVDFIRDRLTTYPTLLELSMAFHNALLLLDEYPQFQDVLDGFNVAEFYRALHTRANYLVNGFFFPEKAMFYKYPNTILHGFYIQHHAFRVRIDDVEHYLSGLVAYRKLLKSGEYPKSFKKNQDDYSLNDNSNKSNDSKGLNKMNTINLPSSTSTEQPLRIGLLRQNKTGFWHPQNTAYAMFYTAKQFNIEIFLFSLEDIDFNNKTINAMFLEENNKVYKRVPFPPIVDNSILYGEQGKLLQKLEKDCYLIRHSLNKNKQQVYDMLLEDRKFEEFLIKSHIIDTFEQFQNLLSVYNNDIVLKPLRGARGIGVARITYSNGKYFVNFQKENLEKNHDEFIEFYELNFTKRKHILQPYIQSKTTQGNPFDIRVHCRRGANGQFKITPFPRIGNAAGIVSNIATGGYSMDFNVFLKNEFGDNWKMIYDKVMDFGKNFPEYYQSFFKTPIFDIGVDMGISKNINGYDFKIFEVNTYIDGPFFEIEDAITHFEYYKYIAKKFGFIKQMPNNLPNKPEHKKEISKFWTPEQLSLTTNGKWINTPTTTPIPSICSVFSDFVAGQLVLVRSPNQQTGVIPQRVNSLIQNGASGLICRDDAPNFGNTPRLIVNDVRTAIKEIARAARNRFNGKSIAITGTSGKTSSTMIMSHVLKTIGIVGNSTHSMNIPVAVAWNMAAMPLDADYWILEMGAGYQNARCNESSLIARPHLAIITNIGPAHLTVWKTMENLAKVKSGIFDGMEEGGVAILFKEMEYFDLFYETATKKGLKVITFGTGIQSDYRLISLTGNVMEFTVHGLPQSPIELSAFGYHSCLNALLAMATLQGLGLDYKQFLHAISSFEPPKGRGNIMQLTLPLNKDVTFTLIDNAYNANPISMHAALSTMKLTKTSHDVVILGDMLELGSESIRYHRELINDLISLSPDRILLVGEQMKNLWELVDKKNYYGKWFPTVDELIAEISTWIKNGDRILAKGSSGSNIWKLVRHLEQGKVS